MKSNKTSINIYKDLSKHAICYLTVASCSRIFQKCCVLSSRFCLILVCINCLWPSTCGELSLWKLTDTVSFCPFLYLTQKPGIFCRAELLDMHCSISEGITQSSPTAFSRDSAILDPATAAWPPVTPDPTSTHLLTSPYFPHYRHISTSGLSDCLMCASLGVSACCPTPWSSAF